MKTSKYIDHTILKADAVKEDILKICREAKEYDFASVCVNPCWIPVAKEALEGTDVKVCVVVGFPLGAMTTEAKVFETQDAVAKGADEVDIVEVAVIDDVAVAEHLSESAQKIAFAEFMLE